MSSLPSQIFRDILPAAWRGESSEPWESAADFHLSADSPLASISPAGPLCSWLQGSARLHGSPRLQRVPARPGAEAATWPEQVLSGFLSGRSQHVPAPLRPERWHTRIAGTARTGTFAGIAASETPPRACTLRDSSRRCCNKIATCILAYGKTSYVQAEKICRA